MNGDLFVALGSGSGMISMFLHRKGGEAPIFTLRWSRVFHIVFTCDETFLLAKNVQVKTRQNRKLRKLETIFKFSEFTVLPSFHLHIFRFGWILILLEKAEIILLKLNTLQVGWRLIFPIVLQTVSKREIYAFDKDIIRCTFVMYIRDLAWVCNEVASMMLRSQIGWLTLQ